MDYFEELELMKLLMIFYKFLAEKKSIHRKKFEVYLNRIVDSMNNNFLQYVFDYIDHYLNQYNSFKDTDGVKKAHYHLPSKNNVTLSTFIKEISNNRYELENKINDFYNALKWDKATTEAKTAKKFFAF